VPVKKILHRMLSEIMHLKRLWTLVLLVETVLETKRLSVTQLGRSLKLPIQERSGIRRSDRFMGNKRVQAQSQAVYGALVKRLIGNKRRPWILVDWSHLPNTDFYVLRAALVAPGRALTLYETVHPESKQGNERVQCIFLKELKKLLPAGSRPVIITDAGFHNPWFKQIVSYGWDYVGRIRGRKVYRPVGAREWQPCRGLWTQASGRAKALGEVELCRKNPLKSRLYLFKGKARGRQGKSITEYRLAAKEPWLLASSLFGRQSAKRVVKLYRTRMQIEEGFRDLKSPAYGFSFNLAYSRDPHRIEVLLLIAALAGMVAWAVGWLTERQQLHYPFQANSIKHRRVLSLFYLGCQVIRRKVTVTVSERTLREVFDAIENEGCPA